MNKLTDTVKEIDEEKTWLLSRKQFIRSILLVGVASQLPILNACSELALKEETDFLNISPLNQKQFKIVRTVQSILFPEEGDGPGALQFNADKYLIWVLNDPLIKKRENEYIIKNIDKLNEVAIKKYKMSFLDLSSKAKERFIQDISSESWSKKWFSRLLTLIFEALLLDPIYGGNPNNIGWEWLNHNPGQPRPTQINNYPTIYNTVNEI